MNLTNINLENNNIITNLNLTISNNLIEIKNQIQLNQISMQDIIKTLEEKTNNNIIKYSDIVKSNLPSSSSTATPPKHPTPTYSYSSKPSIVIEHVLPADRNLTYIKSLFVHLRLDPNTITDYSFRSHFANLVLSSSCTIDSLLHSRSSLHSSDFKSLFIRPYIDPETIKTGRILFHATKVFITNLKCVFNRRSLTYQLRSNIDDVPIDWKADPYNHSTEEFDTLSQSYDSFCESRKKDRTVE